MKKLTVLAIVFLMAPVFSADAASRRHAAPVAKKERSEPAQSPFTAPPVTRLPVAPDTFRA
jgi:hypothetical protein